EQNFQVTRAAHHHGSTSDGRRRESIVPAATIQSSRSIFIPGSLYRRRITLRACLPVAASADSKAERTADHFSSLPEKHSDSQSVARQSARGKDVWRGYFQAGDTHGRSGATDAIDRFRRDQGP